MRPRERACAATVGTFDGVHRGHQHVLARTREIAGPDAEIVAVTFDPHPLAVLRPDRAPRRLTSIGRRVELLRAAGADEVRVLDFTAEMAGWSPREFVERAVVDQLHAAHLVVGENFRFGHRAAGDVDLLRELGPGLGFTAHGLALDGDDEPFSSTLVRGHVAAGRLRDAAHVLGRPHAVEGVVTAGQRRGREIGFPTANVPVDEAYAVPPDGVYAGRLHCGGHAYPAAVSVGTNPTFGEHDRRVESYVIDHGHDLDLYGHPARVDLVEHLRPMVAYEGVDALVQQMHADVDAARAILA